MTSPWPSPPDALGAGFPPKAPVLIALVGSVLAGCVSAQDVDSRLEAWRGQSEGPLVGRYGAPHRTYDLKDGTRMLTYDITRDTVRSSPGQHRFRREPTLYTARTECTLNFTLDATRTVSAVSWEGDLVECASFTKPAPGAGAMEPAAPQPAAPQPAAPLPAAPISK